MAATYMLRKRQRELAALKPPEAVARREAEIDASNRSAADLRGQFPQVTPESFLDADTYHKSCPGTGSKSWVSDPHIARIGDHHAPLSPHPTAALDARDDQRIPRQSRMRQDMSASHILG